MYNDIGKKIKGLAKCIALTGALSAIIVGIFIITKNKENALAGVIVLIAGPIVTWVSSWELYAFGELIDKTCENEATTRESFDILISEVTAIERSIGRITQTAAAADKQAKEQNAAPTMQNSEAEYNVKTYVIPVSKTDAGKVTPVESAPQNKPVKAPVVKSFSWHLHYALQFSTSTGMRGYLKRIAKSSTEEEQEEIKSILSNGDMILRDRITQSKFFESDESNAEK